MKVLYTIIFVLISQIATSQTKVSVSDGNWNDPQNWSPTSVPNASDDTLIINHDIDYFGDLVVPINHVIIGTTGILYGTGTISINMNLQVDGEFIGDTIMVGGAGGEYFLNNGYIESNQFTPSNLMNTNNGYIDILGVFVCPEPFVNATTGIMETLDVVTTSDADFVNNGVIYAENWTNEGTVLGTGSFCIENCFQNLGDITGTLDVCDATPNAGIPCDFNFGTIEPTVTLCAASPCSSSTGLINSTIIADVNVFPNPSNDGRFRIETNATILKVKVIDLTGRLLAVKANGDLHLIDISWMENGEYMLVLETENTATTRRILKSN